MTIFANERDSGNMSVETSEPDRERQAEERPILATRTSNAKALRWNSTGLKAATCWSSANYIRVSTTNASTI